MPFTLSHPAAVLPLLRHPFSGIALVAGAVAPDLPYFARSTPIPVSAQSWYEPFMNATTSHGLLGALTVSLPYALALAAFCWLARRPVDALLPGVIGQGEPRPTTAGALLTRGGWVLLSLLIGIATHLVWDSFTHGNEFVVTHVPLLSSQLVGDLTWARALQHLSTVGGLVLIAVYLWRRRSRIVARVRAGRGRPGRRGARAVLLAIVAVGVVGAVAGTLPLWGRTEMSTPELVEGVLAGGAKGGGAALLVALVVYVGVWWAARGFRTALRR